jgi:hypothetical protein
MRALQITRRVDGDGVLRLEITTEDAGDEVDYRLLKALRNALAHGTRPDDREIAQKV